MILVHDLLDPADLDASPSTDRQPRADVAHLRVPWGRLHAAAVPAALGAPGPRTHLSVTVPTGERAGDAHTGWPDDAAVAGLLAAGVTGVTLREAGGVDADASTRLVGLLAAAMSHGLPVSWELGAADGVERWPFDAEVGALCHLAPPTGDGPRARLWQDRHAYGLLYWRHGQTFATVTDLRDVDQARYVIDDPALLALFLGLEQPRELATLAGADRDRVAELAGAGQVYAAGRSAVRLAFRLRRWPMPLDSLG